MSVEHLWHYNESEMNRLNEQFVGRGQHGTGGAAQSPPRVPLLPTNNGTGGDENLSYLCNVADHRLYKIVKWCKSLPLFQHIAVSL